MRRRFRREHGARVNQAAAGGRRTVATTTHHSAQRGGMRGKRREAGDVAPPSGLPLSPEPCDSPPATSPAAMRESLSLAPSAEDASPRGAGAASPTGVYRFDVGKYKDGSFRFVPASAREFVRYYGRVLHHGPAPARRTKVNTVQFDWSAVAFELRVAGARSVGIRLKGDGNYFNVFVNGELSCILRASVSATCCQVAADLDPAQTYTVQVSKRTEPQMRGAMSTFKVCTFYGFIVDGMAEVLPIDESPAARKIEFIGDSDTCAFGNEGKASSAKNVFGLKGRMENVYNGYACVAARMLNAEAHVLAWSGKGVHSNSADWGPPMPELWTRVLASRPGDWDMSSWEPDVVVINLGLNDLSPPASSETDIIQAYASLIVQVRTHRPAAHIFCAVCDEGCVSAEDSETNRQLVSQQLQEIVRVAISRVNRHDDRIYYTLVSIDGGLQSEDFATLMHYAVSGHVKIAKVLADEIALRTGWSVERPPETMPYPQPKDKIVVSKDYPNVNCCLS